MNIQNAALNNLIMLSLENQAKANGGAGEKTILCEIKSISQNSNAILIALPDNTTVSLEIPQEMLNKNSDGSFVLSAGEKIEIPLNLIKNALISQLQEQNNHNNLSGDKFAATTPSSDKAAEFSKIAETVLRALGIELNNEATAKETVLLSSAEKEFTKALIKEIEQFLRKLTPEISQNLTLPKLENIKNADDFLLWTAVQIKNGNLNVKDFFALPQILFPSAVSSIQNTDFAVTLPQTFPEQTQIVNLPESKNQAITFQNPQEIQFVQQTTANIKENIQNLVPQFQNENIKNILNEMIRQIPVETNSKTQTFAFVKIDANAKNESADFLPLPSKTQFDSEFSAVLSKKFPNLPQKLLVETANIMQNSRKPFLISERVLKNVENIIKNIENFDDNPQTAESKSANQIKNPVVSNQMQTINQWKITPPVLANILNFAAASNSERTDTVLQNFKTLFASEKTIESAADGIKKFLESFTQIEKETLQKPQSQNEKSIIQGEKPLNQNDLKNPQIQTEKPFLPADLLKSLDKLTEIQNLLKNAETLFKKENSIEYLLAKIGLLQNKSAENPQKIEENLRGILREISEQIKTAAAKLQNLPNSESDEKITRAFSNLKNLTNSVNDVLRKIDGANLLANRTDFAQGRNEQTILIPIQIGDAWVQMELRVNKDGKNKKEKQKKEASEVEVSVELEKGNSVLAKANLTLEKQLQVSINFTNEKMLEYFKKNYTEFCRSLESARTKSVQVIFNREKTENQKEKNEIRRSNFELVG